MADNKADGGPGSFAAVLATIRPKTDIELAEKLSQLIEDVKVTGKKGTLTVKFEVKPVDGGGQAVIVNDAIAMRAPEKNREGSMAFIGEGDRLQRTDPSAIDRASDVGALRELQLLRFADIVTEIREGRTDKAADSDPVVVHEGIGDVPIFYSRS